MTNLSLAPSREVIEISLPSWECLKVTFDPKTELEEEEGKLQFWPKDPGSTATTDMDPLTQNFTGRSLEFATGPVYFEQNKVR